MDTQDLTAALKQLILGPNAQDHWLPDDDARRRQPANRSDRQPSAAYNANLLAYSGHNTTARHATARSQAHLLPIHTNGVQGNGVNGIQGNGNHGNGIHANGVHGSGVQPRPDGPGLGARPRSQQQSSPGQQLGRRQPGQQVAGLHQTGLRQQGILQHSGGLQSAVPPTDHFQQGQSKHYQAGSQVLSGLGASVMTADALVARSLLAAKPSPLALPRARGVDSELDWDEELPDTHWPVDDETLFYAKHVATTRTNSTSGGHRKFFDLNISLPVVLPGSEIRVLNAEGENYYHKPGDAAANVLFCCHESTQQEDEISFDPDTVETFTVVEPLTAQIAHDTAYKTTADTTDPVASISASISTSAPRVCDVWSSFLRIHVGTVHNCHADLIQEITEFFLQTLKSVEFLRPIEIQCAGVFQVKNRYETRAKFVATEDLAQFRVIRRALKKFVLTLRERFSVHHQGPVFDATISPVCKTGASLPIEIRRYSILAPDVAAQVKGKQTLAIADEEIPLTANCYINEVRLEMTHARAVDPRWTDAWVLCRRMPMGPGLTPGRHVFAPGHTPPRVLYQFKHPKAKLLKSRFGPLYMLTESALNLTKKQQVEPTRTDRYEADRHDANGQDVAPGANSAAAAPGANLAGAPLGANLAKAALGANLAGAAPDANLAAAAPGAILAATTIKHEDFSPVKTDFGGMMGTESATLEQENNSNLRAEAVPFFPITALNQVLQSFQAETSSNTTWDRLVESALNHENSQQQTKGLELLRALKNGSFKNQSGTYRRPF